jgi:hypothetical protein
MRAVDADDTALAAHRVSTAAAALDDGALALRAVMRAG